MSFPQSLALRRIPFFSRISGGEITLPLIRRLGQNIHCGRLDLRLPSGAHFSFSGKQAGPSARLNINRSRALRRLWLGGDLGFAESYLDGDWDSPDLVALVELAARNIQHLEGTFSATLWQRMAARAFHLTHANSRRGSRRNISAHYDLGNEFYAQWLDETMSYSAACFPEGTPQSPESEDLAEAQREKYRHLARMVGLKPGDKVLEIGCGWGGFAEIAAQEFGCTVKGLTLSHEQQAYAIERLQKAGLSDRVEVALQDYRDETGCYDAIVSIEMFEAVGTAYWPTYFNTVKHCLKDDGKAALQVITIDDSRFQSYSQGCDFIQRYIFPGGMLPSPEKFEAAAASQGLSVDHSRFFGRDYARTLNIWANAFTKNWSKIAPLGFDERFKRLWSFYLAYCEGGFNAGSIDVGHFVLSKSAATSSDDRL